MSDRRRVKQTVLEEHCMTQLHLVGAEHPDDPGAAAFAIATMLCLAWDDIDEVKLEFCLTSGDIDMDRVVGALRWHAGAGFISVHCLGHSFDDVCLASVVHDPEHPTFIAGVNDAADRHERWVLINRQISGFRYAYWETDPDPDSYTLIEGSEDAEDG